MGKWEKVIECDDTASHATILRIYTYFNDKQSVSH